MGVGTVFEQWIALTDALAWPVVALVMFVLGLFVLKAEIRGLLRRVSRVDAPGLGFSFDSIRDIEVGPVPEPDPDAPPPTISVNLDDLRPTPSTGGLVYAPHVDVILAWNNLDFTMRQIAGHFGGPTQRGTSPKELLDWMRGTGMVDAREADAIASLRAVRDRVTHGLDQPIDGMDVEEYRNRVDVLIGVLARRTPSVPHGSA